MNFSKEHLEDSELFPKRFINTEQRNGILLPLIVKNYSKLTHDVIYYVSAQDNLYKWTYKLMITNGTLFAFMSTSVNFKSPAFAIYKANGGHIINNDIIRYRNLIISEFCHEAIMDPENNYLFNDRLIIEFKFEIEQFQSNYYYTNYGSLKSKKDDFELCENLKYMYLETCSTDLRIQVRDETFLVHKAVLATRAKCFANFFQNQQLSHDKITCITIDEVPRIFYIVLIYIYSGELNCLGSEDALMVYELAYKLQIDYLEKSFSDVIERILSPSILQKFLYECLKLELKNSIQFVVGCIKKNCPEMIDIPQFKDTFVANFSPSNVKFILAVAVKFELENVVNCAVDYIKRNCSAMFDTEIKNMFDEAWNNAKKLDS